MTHAIWEFVARRLKGSNHHNVSDRYATIPNAITSLGLAGIVAYASLLLSNSALWLLPIVHVEIFLSDALDGMAADWLDQHTRLGKALDPLRDRLHGILVLGTVTIYDGSAIAFVIMAVAAELCIGALAYAKHIREVHMVGKLRALVYWIAGLTALCELFWFKVTYVPLSACIAAMGSASICSLIMYTYVSNRPSHDHRRDGS